jgi:NADPH-dependent curcumin reductase CurA
VGTERIRQIVLAARPHGRVLASDFRLQEADLPRPETLTGAIEGTDEVTTTPNSLNVEGRMVVSSSVHSMSV